MVFYPSEFSGNRQVKKFLLKSISFILIFSMLFQFNGCYYYKAVEKSESPDQVIGNPENGNFYILHLGNDAWELTITKMTSNHIEAIYMPLEGHEYYLNTNYDSPNRYRKKGKVNESEVLNEVHIWVKEFEESETGKAVVNFDKIESIIVYDQAVGAIVASWAVSTALIAGASYFIAVGLILLIKGSCPFIYTYDGSDYLLAGEIFSGAIYPDIEREDFLPLNELVPNEDKYNLYITNEIREIQHTNFVELYCIDHTAGEQILFDKYGNMQTIADPFAPSVATNLSGENVLEIISSKDSLLYYGGNLLANSEQTDGLILDFEVPERVTSAKLQIKAKNSFWLEYVYKSFHDMLGSKYSSFTEMKEASGKEALLKDMVDQKLPIVLSIEENGEWNYVDYFNLTGPMALKEDILTIPLDNIEEGKVRVKLEYGAWFWEIDYVAMDVTENIAYPISKVSLSSAIDENDNNVLSLLESADDQYYIQPRIGNAAKLEFPVPKQKGDERSIILHSQGYYRVDRHPDGKPQIRELKKMKERGGLPYLSVKLAEEGKSLDNPE